MSKTSVAWAAVKAEENRQCLISYFRLEFIKPLNYILLHQERERENCSLKQNFNLTEVWQPNRMTSQWESDFKNVVQHFLTQSPAKFYIMTSDFQKD